MWNRGGFKICGGDFVELGKTKREKKDMITDRNPNLGFTVYDLIHRNQNQYPKQIASFFIIKIIQ